MSELFTLMKEITNVEIHRTFENRLDIPYA